ncbi:hypothetical protein THRCLA_21367 [Thraustotheca clavata]|uniref:Transmembrane protein n=1 Tax=Thraustotheca clavata TaxID=74557 RepID=A0A1V9ZXC6_9STRA|nr:hypothetical protein THRCLA_21367 [Thraustotheca clavata]
MYERSATAFYANSMTITGSRYLILSQKQLLRLAYGNTSKILNGVLATNVLSSPSVGDGTYIPGPINVYRYIAVVGTMAVLLSLASVFNYQSTRTGISTIIHFMVGSLLAIFLDCVYEFALFTTGPKTLFYDNNASLYNNLPVYGKAIEHITVIQCTFIRSILAQFITPSVIDIGMRRGTNIDLITSYVYHLQMGFLGFGITFLHIVCFVSLWTKNRQGGRPHPSVAIRQMAFIWSNFTSLVLCTINSLRHARLFYSVAEALFNMNWNLFTSYSLALESRTVLYMEQTGRIYATEIIVSKDIIPLGTILIGGVPPTQATPLSRRIRQVNEKQVQDN